MMTSITFIPPVPSDTNQAAKATYSRDNFYMVVGDRLVHLLTGVDQNRTQPEAITFQREKPSLAMITVFQFIEDLPDRQAAESTRTRVDWKYALHLSMNFPGLPGDSLCKYRQWVLQEPFGLQRFQIIIDRLVAGNLLVQSHAKVVQADAILDEVCSITRLDKVSRAMESAIEALATHQLKWLQDICQPHWYTRYPISSSLNPLPCLMTERNTFIEAIGDDIFYLLGQLAAENQPELFHLEEIQSLHQVWQEQFEQRLVFDTMLLEHCSNCQTRLDESV